MENKPFISPQGTHSFSKFIKGFGYAFKGLKHAFKTQINFKFHTATALLTLAAGIFFNLRVEEWLWLTLAIALVLITELFNTALEHLVDLVSPAINPKAGIIKDLASAAVLLTAAFAFIVGLVIFIPKLHF